MDAPIEPAEADVIILGTGLPETLLAASLSLSGIKVIHLDSAEFYGGLWATLQLPLLDELATQVERSFRNLECKDPANISGIDTLPECEGKGGEAREEGIIGKDSLNGGENGEIGRGGGRDRGEGKGLTEESSGNGSTGGLKLDDVELLPLKLTDNFFIQQGCSQVSVYGSVNNVQNPSSFSFDLSGPRLALCGEPLIDVVIRTGAHNYLEFKPTDGVYLFREGKPLAVPSSRADIFQASMSLSEKRVVSRFFKRLTDYIAKRNNSGIHSDVERANAGSSVVGDLGLEDLDGSFVDLLRRQQLPKNIREFVLYALALITEDQEKEIVEGEPSHLVSTREGLKSVTLYLESIGRFGAASAFLYPMYGQGEMPQAFCRVAAVRGAIYVLRRPVDAILVDKLTGECRGVHTKFGQMLYSPKVVIGPGFWPVSKDLPREETGSKSSSENIFEKVDGGLKEEEFNKKKGPSYVARCLCIVDSSIIQNSSTIFLVFPPKSLESQNSHAIRCLQVSSATATAPRDHYVVHFSTPCPNERTSSESLLRPAVLSLFDFDQPPSSSFSVKEGTNNFGEVSKKNEEDQRREGLGFEEIGSSEVRGVEGREKDGGEGREKDGGEGREKVVNSEGAELNLGGEGEEMERIDPKVEGIKGDNCKNVGSNRTEKEGKKPKILWCMFYNQELQRVPEKENLPSGVIPCGMSDETINFRAAIEATEKAFSEISPGLPFCPPPPPSSLETQEETEEEALTDDNGELEKLLAKMEIKNETREGDGEKGNKTGEGDGEKENETREGGGEKENETREEKEMREGDDVKENETRGGDDEKENETREGGNEKEKENQLAAISTFSDSESVQ